VCYIFSGTTNSFSGILELKVVLFIIAYLFLAGKEGNQTSVCSTIILDKEK